MAVTIDKILGKPLSHSHVSSDIIFPGGATLVTTSVTTVSTDTTLSSVATILVNAASAPVTITLPAAATYANQIYQIKKIDSSSNAVTVDGNGSETIDGDTTAIIAFQYSAMDIISNGTSWFII